MLLGYRTVVRLDVEVYFDQLYPSAWLQDSKEFDQVSLRPFLL
jgi:hypothetical protein